VQGHDIGDSPGARGQTYTERLRVERTKGCSVYAVDVQVRGNPQADTHRAGDGRKRSPLDLLLRLAVVIRKRLVALEWVPSTGDFREIRELALPDVPKTLTWIGEAFLLGFRREYAVIYVRVLCPRVVGAPILTVNI
jgi:Vam6/Vps39-like protein vacuolar protein sorting-associated protein 39